MTTGPRLSTLLFVLALCAITAANPSPPSGDGPVFDLSWHTVDGGGGISTGGGFEVRGTIGQHDTGATMIGGDFELFPGFWGTPSSTSSCHGDVDGSGDVGFSDILAILGAWGNAGGPEDIDGSGFVDFGDLLIVLAAWGPCE